MAGLAEQAARTEQELRSGLSDTSEGICEGYDWPSRLVIVNLGGVPIGMPWIGDAPWKGDTVRVLWLGKKPICHSVYGSAMGTVGSVTSNIATVAGDDGKTYLYPVAAGSSFTGGDRVCLLHSKQLVVAQYSVEPLASEFVVPGAPPAGVVGSRTFRPTSSGNFRYGVYAGQDVQVNVGRTGVYWYGTQIADTIPDGATITKATLQLVEVFDYLPGVASMLGTHGQIARGGEPTITGTIPVTGGGTVNILSLATALKTGAAYGVGFEKATGYRSFASYASSGAITITWQ